MLDTPDLDGRVAFITGTTRGIGKAIALSLAECGADVVSTGKTTETDDADLPGSVEQTAREIRERGVESLAIPLDVRDERAVHDAVDRTVEELGSVDVLVNNAGAIQLANVADMPAKRFDLMMDVNVRAAYVCSRAVLPYMREQEYGHVLMASPPIRVEKAPGKAAYALSKLGMTFLALSLADELAGENVGVNAFWPVTAIDSRATRYFGMGTEEDWRTPEVLCDTVREIVRQRPSECTGNAFYDEEVLRAAGVEDFSRYAVVEGASPGPASARLFDPDYEPET
ncbi:SDR family oxidoreductase [Halomarina ordinaria]|uniref:SDR family oxidoreductase n=1 Tax=Halomarina ordinaria TaxID=3033939 RepID=A0ABD5U954_9EURY|nr:SDR family oxidoreductase [Halomarina sp. PSRA2]